MLTTDYQANTVDGMLPRDYRHRSCISDQVMADRSRNPVSRFIWLVTDGRVTRSEHDR